MYSLEEGKKRGGLMLFLLNHVYTWTIIHSLLHTAIFHAFIAVPSLSFPFPDSFLVLSCHVLSRLSLLVRILTIITSFHAMMFQVSTVMKMTMEVNLLDYPNYPFTESRYLDSVSIMYMSYLEDGE